jgi:hypothetical protein
VSRIICCAQFEFLAVVLLKILLSRDVTLYHFVFTDIYEGYP